MRFPFNALMSLLHVFIAMDPRHDQGYDYMTLNDSRLHFETLFMVQRNVCME